MSQIEVEPTSEEEAHPADDGIESRLGQRAELRAEAGLLRSLRKRWPWVVSFAILGFVLGAIYFMVDSYYTARAQVTIQLVTSNTSNDPQSDTVGFVSFFQRQMDTVTRADVLAATLKRLGRGFQKPGESAMEAEARLKKTVAVSRIPHTNQILIEATAKTADQAAEIANLLARNYLDTSVHDAGLGDDDRLKLLNEERERVQDELASDRAELEDLKQQAEPTSTSQAPDHFDKEIGQIRAELAKARTAHDEAEARIGGMKPESGSNSPSQTRAGLRSELQRTAEVEARLKGELRQLVSAATESAPRLQQSKDLVEDIARQQRRIAKLDEQWNSLLSAAGAPGGAFLSQAATPPLHKSGTGTTLTPLWIALAGLVLGVLVAFGITILDRRVYVRSDVERVLGYAPMAVLPVFDEVSEQTAGALLQRLAFVIEAGRESSSLKSLLFTGACSETGVTTVLTRVQGTLEQMGRRTVLLDATGTSPAPKSGTGILGLTAREGLQSTPILQRISEEKEDDRNSFILIDSAPLLLAAETESMARFADCVIVVLRSGVSTRSEIRKLAQRLEQLDVKAVGFVLNGVKSSRSGPELQTSIEAEEVHFPIEEQTHEDLRELDQEPEPISLTDELSASEPEEAEDQPDDSMSASESKSAVPTPVLAEVPWREQRAPQWWRQEQAAPAPVASPAIEEGVAEIPAPPAEESVSSSYEPEQAQFIEPLEAHEPAHVSLPASEPETGPPQHEEAMPVTNAVPLVSPPDQQIDRKSTGYPAQQTPVRRASSQSLIQLSLLSVVDSSDAPSTPEPVKEDSTEGRVSKLSELRNLFHLGGRSAPVDEPVDPPQMIPVSGRRTRRLLFDESIGQRPNKRKPSSTPAQREKSKTRSSVSRGADIETGGKGETRSKTDPASAEDSGSEDA